MAAARGLFFVMAALALAFTAGSASTAPAAAAPALERVWGDGKEWQSAIGTETAIGNRWQPFYMIAPIDGANPQSRGRLGIGPHDNVMNVPPHIHGTGIGPCKVLLVVPGANGIAGVNIDVLPDPDLGIPFVRAADTDGDGVLEPLTSVAVVERANAEGLVSLFEPQPGGAPIVFMCPVRPLHA
ncbi:MAG TPA: hypothetical protein VGR51_06690 [Thermoplasmata archaeon]|jgi:hypothetical protein|nr:hypothetical protein [Thermoplasmata archaeon]